MQVFVLGVALHPAEANLRHLRLEEVAYATARSALDGAGVTRRQLDSLTIGACDELDGRPISSMLMSAPAGGYGVDEIKVTDSGASALALAYARFLSGESQLGLVMSWCKTSKTDVETVMRMRGDPFYTRPLGIGAIAGDGLFAQAVSEEFGIGELEVAQRVVAAYSRASKNPRGLRHRAPTGDEVRRSPFEATPMRSAHRAPYSDGAAALVLASEDFVSTKRGCRPLARIAGVGWASESYRLDRKRLRAMSSARAAWSSAMRQTGWGSAADLDVVELETPTAYHEAAYARAFGIDRPESLSPSGGSFAQYPLFCSGLVNAVEAVLQVCREAGEVQVKGARRAFAHGCHGIAQQGNVVMAFEAMGVAQ